MQGLIVRIAGTPHLRVTTRDLQSPSLSIGTNNMRNILLASAAMLAIGTGIATAQTTTSQTTTTVSPAPAMPIIVPPPVGTLSTTRTKRVLRSDGSQTDSRQTTYRNTTGVANDTLTQTTTYPPAAITTTTKSKTIIKKN